MFFSFSCSAFNIFVLYSPFNSYYCSVVVVVSYLPIIGNGHGGSRIFDLCQYAAFYALPWVFVTMQRVTMRCTVHEVHINAISTDISYIVLILYGPIRFAYLGSSPNTYNIVLFSRVLASFSSFRGFRLENPSKSHINNFSD